MSAFSRWRDRLRALFTRDALDRDLDSELAHWVGELADRYEARGLSPEDARRAALHETGGVEAVKERVRDVRPRALVDGLRRDIAYASRSVFRAPVLLAAIVVTLALGIGANTAVYSAIHSLLLQPPPYRAPDRLAILWGNMEAGGIPRARLSGLEVAAFQAVATKLDGIAAVISASAALTGAGDPEQLRVGRVTWNFFDVLGVGASRGRTFVEDDAGLSPSPAVVSWALFEQRFGGDPAVLGRQVVLDGAPLVIVGVLPRGFRLHVPADAAIPDDLQIFHPLAADLARGPAGIRSHRVLARLAAGATIEDAQREVASIAADLTRRFPAYAAARHSFYVVPLLQDNTRDVRPALWALAGGVLVVLVTACVNVMGLLLARAVGRRREIATLVALGAGRARLARQFVVEGLMIAAAGTAAGLGAGFVLLQAIVALRPPTLDRLQHASIQTPVLAGIAILAGLCGLLFALAPLADALRLDPSLSLQKQGERTAGGRSRPRAALVACQIALSTVLAVTTALLGRTVDALYRTDVGFDLQARALTFRLAWPAAPYHGRLDVNAFSRELETRLNALPGVEEAGAISHLPFDSISNWAGRYLTESTAANEMATRFADVRAVSPGVLRSLGVTLVEGRWFTEADDERQSLVSIVDERLAALAWPGRSAIGQRLRVGMYADRTVIAGWTTVVGVVRHMRHRRPDAEAQEQIYVPFRQSLPPTMAYIVRTAADPARLSSEVRRVVASLDGLLPPYDIQPLAAYVARATSARRFTALLFSLFALLTLVLACVGLAGLISHSVTVRQREFGIRLALGATPAGVRSKVLTEALQVAAAGLGAGIVASIVAANAMRALLFGVGPVDAVSYAGAIAVLGLAGAAACWWPARRASRVSPMDALRSE